MPRTCIFGCRTGGLNLHVFPTHDAARFKTWVEVVSQNMGTPADCNYYRRKRICDKHFAEQYKVANNRVSHNAVPTLHLNGYPSEVRGQEYSLSPQPMDEIMSCQSSTVSAAVIEMDHDYSRPMVIRNSKKKSSTKYSVNVMEPLIVSQLKTTQRQVKNLKREVCRLRKKGRSLKERLENAEKLTNNIALKRVTKNMSSASKLFTEMQFRETAKKAKGRRFKIEEKVLALSLYKRSPRMYPLLSKFFTLPSAKTLKQMLSKIKLKEGINPIIIDKIKKSVKEMNVKDRLCTLIFDEMSLSPQVHYDAARDELIGLTNDGKIADHVLVFMIKGINLKFKQPVAYHFTNCLNKFELKNMIIEVIKALQRTGLNIICTVCDQSTVNVSAINELIRETKGIYLKNGQEYKYDHFIVKKNILFPFMMYLIY